jgi:hypothetical protein
VLRRGAAMTPDEVKRRAEAVRRWVDRTHADPAPPCPVCAGVKWLFRLETPGPFLPQACTTCG